MRLQEDDLLGEDEEIGDGSGYAAECIREPHSDNEDADYVVSDHDTNSECSETEELPFFLTSVLFLVTWTKYHALECLRHGMLSLVDQECPDQPSTTQKDDNLPRDRRKYCYTCNHKKDCLSLHCL
ncbi:unnamed protein product [Parnassius apollo]|uniref:(apollo) hypothetical protein n=1 Tax=Parnassius apollo TaxID=110799 RepID=A0A8S3WPQ5_PARAO|nr:unnamed protein product [Parnassius apollo]